MSLGRILFVSFVGVGLAVACSPPDFAKTPGEVPPEDESPSATSSGGSCVGDAGASKLDAPDKYSECSCTKGGKARCVPAAKVDPLLVDNLAACNDGNVCLPDTLFTKATPKTCKSFAGEGRCVSTCVPAVEQKLSLLNRGENNVCPEDERCIPCIDPSNGLATGVCDFGKSTAATAAGGCSDGGTTTTPTPKKDGGTATPLACPYTGPALIDVKSFDSCGEGARCIPKDIVSDTSAVDLLKACSTAKTPTGVCAPEKVIAASGKFVPKTCASVGGVEGRCSNVVIPAVDKQKSSLPQDVCDSFERCSPCFNPVDGKATGACSTVECDKPAKAATLFKGCCNKDNQLQGKCVPKSMIPVSGQSKLTDDNGTCEQGNLCAPSEGLVENFKPAACTASTFFTGQYCNIPGGCVCVSDCVKFSFLEGLATSKGNCTNAHTCVPCSQNGNPTGVPGCPNTPAP